MHRKWVTRGAAILFSAGCAAFCVWTLTAEAAANSTSAERQGLLAATPPMGWNSWDAYAETVSESAIKANAAWMARTSPPVSRARVSTSEVSREMSTTGTRTRPSVLA